ncbi:MAG: hypothetical protein ACK42F_07955, partial [Sphingobacteriales bacterium]
IFMRIIVYLLVSIYYFTLISCDSKSKSSDTVVSNNTGTVIVDLTYPSEYLPEMDVFLLNVQNKQL